MAKTSPVKVLEHLYISPPVPNSSPPQTGSSLPLTFFDIPWLFFSPSQPLFFYEYPHPTNYFTSTALPNLKRSLSLTLQLYYPFAGNLNLPSEPGKPHLVCSQADNNKVLLTVAESAGDFNHLSGNRPRDVNEFYQLVPELLPPYLSADEERLLPLLAVQITVFPSSGFCIGLAYHQVVADERTFNNFIKTWASFCSFGDSYPIKSLPSFDRKVIVDAYGLEEILLKEWWQRRFTKKTVFGTEANDGYYLSNMVRTTFVVGSKDMERIKMFIVEECNVKNESLPEHLSAYILTCAFIWVCLVKTQEGLNNEKYGREDPNYLGFIAGGITRLDFPVPTTYFGNCVGFGRAMARRNGLAGEDGLVAAAKAIGSTVKRLDKAILEGAEKWISDWKVLFRSEIHVMLAGSPKVDLYETDFGLGRPKKIEDISIDSTGAISLAESRDVKGGIEVGLVLPKPQMDAFSSFFNEGLKALPLP
ncbi:anthocyanin 5-aromatic acyltransferase-like [Juglans microcarpa x Juglans regia]|uniref:anthocyanin 5-aromatic acyltransferase-like n=1 Tax=Juglans microcarpa x Juglans regia TaxID=2249226 RepID=UPI001B7DC2E1|nr:anthocyanin 5-aromatic acyltransferase-like [Juglans microcarpa x Juglans regia]